MNSLQSLTKIGGVVGACYLLLLYSCTCANYTSKNEFAIALHDKIIIAETQTWKVKKELAQYQEVNDIAYAPIGGKLAIGDCKRNDVIELETNNYTQVAVPLESDRCPLKIAYSPDGMDVAAGVIYRPFHISGQHPLDTMIGVIKAIQYHPGGKTIAVATERDLQIWSVGVSYIKIYTNSNLKPECLGYSIDGTRLFAGTNTGWVVLDATRDFALLATFNTDPVKGITIDPRGHWVALLQDNKVLVHRMLDFRLEHSFPFPAGTHLRDVKFSPDGGLIAIARQKEKIHIYTVSNWEEIHTFPFSGDLRKIAFKPDGIARQPVLFIHGHSVAADSVWFSRAGFSSFAGVLDNNPAIPIHAIYLQMPLHGTGHEENENIGIDANAMDVLALIEGGTDSRGGQHVGLVNFPAYSGKGKVSIVGYSQGGITSRYYVKHLMGTRGTHPVTVSELILLATPNHGLGDYISCWNISEPDLAKRQLCGGFHANLISRNLPCNQCGNAAPMFASNTSPEDTLFFARLNGHHFADDCNDAFVWAGEAPFSKPTNPEGILYVNLYLPLNRDWFAGGATSLDDCKGRRLARMHAADVNNREVSSITPAHQNFPHDSMVICTVLKVLRDHAMPADNNQVCDGINLPNGR